MAESYLRTIGGDEAARALLPRLEVRKHRESVLATLGDVGSELAVPTLLHYASRPIESKKNDERWWRTFSIEALGKLDELREQRETMIAKLDGFEITLMRAANEQGVLFGSVSQHDLAEALQEEGFNITEREVRLGDPIKHHDSYMVPIQLDTDLRTEVKVWVVSDKPAEELMSEAVAEAESEEVAEDAEAELVEQPPRDLNA